MPFPRFFTLQLTFQVPVSDRRETRYQKGRSLESHPYQRSFRTDWGRAETQERVIRITVRGFPSCQTYPDAEESNRGDAAGGHDGMGRDGAGSYAGHASRAHASGA